DKWLAAGTIPPEAVDNCLDASGQRISGHGIYDNPGPCRDDYPLHGDPRTAAGAPLRNDIMKCRLTPVDAASYKASFTAAQDARLRVVFPQCVCDWTRPGVGQVPVEGTWLRY